MHITLIGMSNIGKSHWGRDLAARGYEHIACDALIEQKLGPELTRHGYAGIRDVAKWMGQPYDAQYPETSTKYLACERAVMEESITRLKTSTGKPCVIDTTGSVIYTGDDIATQLKALTRVVYLEASEAHIAQLFERYIKNPKPVIWGSSYAPHPGENAQDALRRCYPDFLRGRAARYAAIAHVTIPYEQHRAGAADMMSLIGAACP